MRVRSIVTGLLIGALLPGMALSYTGIFRTAFTSGSGGNPTGIAVGDFDRDGAVDAAVSNGDGTDISVQVGLFSCAGGDRAGQFCFQATDCPGGMCKPDGTLSNVGSISLDSFPSALLQGQFDDDALDDLIVAQTNIKSVVFLKGRGDTEFFDAPGPPVSVGEGPVGLAGADIDGDGTRDLVVANEGVEPAPGSITILKGDGDGTFTLLQQPKPDEPGEFVNSLPAGQGTRAVAIGNVNADPALDILALNARSNPGTISIFSGDGEGIFTPGGTVTTGTEPQDVALRDLNGDGDLDLVLANFTDDTVSVRFGNGDGTFAADQSYPVGTAPNRIAFGEMGGDNRPDLVVSNNRSGDVSVLLANGPGTFGKARNFFADAEPQAVGLGDFNQDGLLDAAVATQGSSDVGASVAVLRNRGGGVLHAVEDIPRVNGPSDVTSADLDGDGLPDLLVAGGAGSVLVFPALSQGFGSPTVINIGGRTLGVVAPDLNGDARPDIVATDTENSRIAVILSQGGGRFAAPVHYFTAPNPGGVTVGDFNNDGRPDIAVAAVRDEAGVCQGGSQPGADCVRDEDCGTGGICARPGTASVLLQLPDGTLGAARNTPVEQTPIGIAALDANCDGRDDLVVANLASSTVSVLRSNNDGSFTPAQTLSETQIGLNPIALAVADFNRDGMDDFAVANTVAPGNFNNVRLFQGNSDCSGTFSAFPGSGQRKIGEYANALVARDFNGDQFVDIGVTSQISNEVCVALGGGDGTLNLVGQGSCDRVSRMPISVAAADFDADGRYDAASANNAATSNNLSVLFNCIRDVGCDPFPSATPPPPIAAALRGDGNDDGRRSAADLVAVATEVMDGDGFRAEDIEIGSEYVASPGVDANGDGRVDAQDRLAVAHRIFGGA